MPYGITQCYLPPGRGDIPAFTLAEAGTRFSDPRGMQGRVDPGGWLEMVYPLNGHPSWTNQARCWLTSLMRPTTLTTTPSRHAYLVYGWLIQMLFSLTEYSVCRGALKFQQNIHSSAVHIMKYKYTSSIRNSKVTFYGECAQLTLSASTWEMSSKDCWTQCDLFIGRKLYL